MGGDSVYGAVIKDDCENDEKVLKTKKRHRKNVVFRFFGGDKQDRTADLLNAMGPVVNTNEYLCIKQSK